MFNAPDQPDVTTERADEPEVDGGALFFAADNVFRLLRAWRDWNATAPRAVETTFRVLRHPAQAEVPAPVRDVDSVCVDGADLDRAAALRLERCLRGFAVPILGGFTPMPSAGRLRLHGHADGLACAVADGLGLSRLDDWAIDAFCRLTGPATPLQESGLRHLGRFPGEAGARDRFLVYGVGVPASSATAAGLDAYLARCLSALAPWGCERPTPGGVAVECDLPAGRAGHTCGSCYGAGGRTSRPRSRLESPQAATSPHTASSRAKPH